MAGHPRRFVLALVGTAVLAAIVAGVLTVLGVARSNLVVGVACVVVASLVWLPATRRWNARAHVCWASSVFLFVAYLAFILQWTFASGLGVASTAGGLLLWLLEVAAAVLACAYLWELCDALGTERWRRRVTRDTPRPVPAGGLPFVSLQVPAHNEPPDMVIQTLGGTASTTPTPTSSTSPSPTESAATTSPTPSAEATSATATSTP